MVNLVELATRIKAARKAQNLTLDQVAKRAELGKGLISKVENFRVTPSLPSVARIAAALNIPLEKLFEGLDSKPSISIVRREDKKEVERNQENSTIQYFDLAFPRPNRGMDPLKLKIPAKGGRREQLPHEGEEFMHVISGDITFNIDDTEYQLSSGDSVYFNAETPHSLINESDEECHIICVFLGPSYERTT